MELSVYSFHQQLQADDSIEGLARNFSECYFPWFELLDINVVHKERTAAAFCLPTVGGSDYCWTGCLYEFWVEPS